MLSIEFSGPRSRAVNNQTSMEARENVGDKTKDDVTQKPNGITLGKVQKIRARQPRRTILILQWQKCMDKTRQRKEEHKHNSRRYVGTVMIATANTYRVDSWPLYTRYQVDLSSYFGLRFEENYILQLLISRESEVCL